MEKLKLIKCWKTMLLLICMSMFSGTIFAQGITIHGKVVDDKGEALIGATVKVKASPTTATTTSVSGDFTLRIPANTTVVTVSYIGYVSTDIAIKPNSSNLGNIILANDANSLNEVVVVGYGAQNKRDVTGSIAQVSASTLQESPSSNFVDELKGRTAGVDIVSNGAGPGASSSIRIRGNRSMATSSSAADQIDQPLYVVDGIPFAGQLNDINQDDIASLEILKDASATAIYGSRGSGGVILITTKRGKTGKGVVSYNAYYGVSSILGELPVFNGPEYAAFKAQAAAGSDNGTTAYPLTVPDLAGQAAGTNTDWQKLIYQKGYTTDQNIDVSGGDEATQYSLGTGYFVQTGNTKNTRFERYSLRTTVDHKIGKNIRVGLNTLNTLTYNNNPGGTGLESTAIKISPLVSPYMPNGEINMFPFTGSIDAPSYISPLFALANPAAVLNNTRRLSTFNTLYGEVSFLKYFKYRINVGLTYNQQQQEQYTGIFGGASILNSSLTTASVANAEYYKYTLENLLTFDRTIGKNKIGFTGLFSAEKTHNDNNYFQGTGIPFDYISSSNLGQANSITSLANQNGYAETGLVSYMARVNYSYDSRYLLTATVRVDGSSVLAPGHNYYTYPALALGWNITNEQWMKDVQTIDNLKFRVGYGKTANQGVAAYTTLGALGASPYEYGGTTAGNQPGYRVTTLANPTLGWESTGEFNAGFDFGLFKDRLTGSIDVYTQKTTGILVTSSLPPSNGASSQTNNFGASSSKGLEITLSSINIQNKGGFSWSTDFNIAFSRERIDALYSGVAQDINNGWFVGQPLTVIYDVKKLGIWQTGDPGLAKQTAPIERAGMIKVQDVDGNGKIDANDRQVVGNYQPQYSGGITNRFAYKRFDLSVVINARMGMDVVAPYLGTDNTNAGSGFMGQGRLNQVKVNYWTPTNPTNDYPQPDATLQAPYYASTLAIRDGSFIRVRSINFGYNIPSAALAKLGISSLRIYATAQDPFFIYAPFVSKGYGSDPEGNGYGNNANGGTLQSYAGGNSITPQRGITVNALTPSTRQFNLGVNLKF